MPVEEYEGSCVTQTNPGKTSKIPPHLLLAAPPSAWHLHLHHNPIYKLMQDHEQPPPSDQEVWKSEDTNRQKRKLNTCSSSKHLTMHHSEILPRTTRTYKSLRIMVIPLSCTLQYC